MLQIGNVFLRKITLRRRDFCQKFSAQRNFAETGDFEYRFRKNFKKFQNRYRKVALTKALCDFDFRFGIESRSPLWPKKGRTAYSHS
ncbi:hypothetical protein DLM77_12140 [Leptospira yasudae]|uniref:Uncharacterized protein n=1 Tax=Leptospira yasudae TaxID=2202201 RepID=A0ABX9M2D7_9LEPT|nr:hypothetical protein DLM77_12140 [Leptospira yasudae]